MIAPIIVIAAIVALDQFTKYMACAFLAPVGSVTLIPGLVDLTFIRNDGAAFGLFQNMRWFFVIATVLVLGFVVYAAVKKMIDHPLLKWSVTLVVGGAIGNLIDRALSGSVVDMFEFTFIRFAIFNVADIFVSVGGVLLCVYFLFFYKKKQTETGIKPSGNDDDKNDNNL